MDILKKGVLSLLVIVAVKPVKKILSIIALSLTACGAFVNSLKRRVLKIEQKAKKYIENLAK